MSNVQPAPASAAAPVRDGWCARLALRYRCEGGRTVVGRTHRGPLVVQRSLYPEGESLCQNIIVHPPGGIAGGDRLQIDVEVAAHAQAQLTTPGATKWYGSDAATASQEVTLRVGEAALAEWLPQEAIVFDRARARQATRVELAASARYCGWEIVCLGRGAAGERFASGELGTTTELFVDGAPRWVERLRLPGGSPLLHSPVGLAGERVFGTLLAYAPALPPGLVERCREISPQRGDGVVSAVQGVLVARIRGGTTETAREWFEAVWTRLRPELLGRAAVRPRIWRT